MRKTITVRVPDELADWLSTTAEKTGMPQGWIVREQLERARRAEKRPFLRLAGRLEAAARPLPRKGLARKTKPLPPPGFLARLAIVATLTTSPRGDLRRPGPRPSRRAVR